MIMPAMKEGRPSPPRRHHRRSRPRQHARRADERPGADRRRTRPRGRHRRPTASGHIAACARPARAGRGAGPPPLCAACRARGRLRPRGADGPCRPHRPAAHPPRPRDPALRTARVCYDHLAGEWGVRLYDGLLADGRVTDADGSPVLTPRGRAFFAAEGIDVPAPSGSRRPLCRACLDWSERRPHLAGALGKAILDHALARHWLRRLPDSRALAVTPPGLQALRGWTAAGEAGGETLRYETG